jgi:hypothetical protein
MVLTPEELEEKILDSEKPAMLELEKLIDRTLVSVYDGRPVNVSYNRYELRLRDLTLNLLAERYSNSGWKIDYAFDSGSTRYLKVSRLKTFQQAKTLPATPKSNSKQYDGPKGEPDKDIFIPIGNGKKYNNQAKEG